MPFNLIWWGLFGSRLDEMEDYYNGSKYLLDTYLNQRNNLKRQLIKYPKARNTIRQLDLMNYREYVSKMLDLGSSEIIQQFEDLL